MRSARSSCSHLDRSVGRCCVRARRKLSCIPRSVPDAVGRRCAVVAEACALLVGRAAPAHPVRFTAFYAISRGRALDAVGNVSSFDASVSARGGVKICTAMAKGRAASGGGGFVGCPGALRPAVAAHPLPLPPWPSFHSHSRSACALLRLSCSFFCASRHAADSVRLKAMRSCRLRRRGNVRPARSFSSFAGANRAGDSAVAPVATQTTRTAMDAAIVPMPPADRSVTRTRFFPISDFRPCPPVPSRSNTMTVLSASSCSPPFSGVRSACWSAC